MDVGAGAELGVEQMQRGEWWKGADAGGKGAEELDGAEAVGIQSVVDVLCEIGADGLGADGEARRPLGDELLGVGEAGFAAGGEVSDELLRGETCGYEGFGARSPDGGDPGESGELAPEMGEVKPEKWGVGCGVELSAVLACEECGIADEECGIGRGEHGQRIGGLVDEGRVGGVEVLEEDAGVGDGTAAGGVGGDAADAGESIGGGQVAGILDEQEDTADLVERGDGAAGDDGECGCEGCDGDEAEVGGAAVELGSADRGQGVMHVVVLAQRCGCGLMFKVEEQWSGIQERDGGDA